LASGSRVLAHGRRHLWLAERTLAALGSPTAHPENDP
jgi:hypothetical protein